jgi:urease accessory protein
MIRATAVLPAGSWSGAPADTVLLDFEARHRRRVAMSAKGGVCFLLDLPAAVGLRHGDGLLLEDGRIIAIEAAAEPLADAGASNAAALAQLAWFLGSQQVPVQFMAAHLRIRRDAVLEAALTERGAKIAPVSAPFDPEEGGYVQAWRGGAAHSQGFAYSHGFHRYSGPGMQDNGEHGFAEAFGDAYSASRSPGHSYYAAGNRPPSGRDPHGDPDRRDAGNGPDGANHRPD